MQRAPYPVSRQEKPVEKAARLLRQARVTPVPSALVYEVIGDSANYRVIVDSEGMVCTCRASEALCAHVIAVAALRAKEISVGGSPADFSVRLGTR